MKRWPTPVWTFFKTGRWPALATTAAADVESLALDPGDADGGGASCCCEGFAATGEIGRGEVVLLHLIPAPSEVQPQRELSFMPVRFSIEMAAFSADNSTRTEQRPTQSKFVDPPLPPTTQSFQEDAIEMVQFTRPDFLNSSTEKPGTVITQATAYHLPRHPDHVHGVLLPAGAHAERLVPTFFNRKSSFSQ